MAKKNKALLERLVKAVRLHKYLYYNKHLPRISDQAYDALINEVKEIDPNHVVLSEVGVEPEENGWQKANHLAVMRSLANAMTIDEYTRWSSGSWTKGRCVVAEDKFDGLTIELIYEAGKFAQGITRGNGKVGDDITINVQKMMYFKPTIKDKIKASIRGEILLFKKDFDEINAELAAVGKKPFANPRNAASGICKRFDGKYCDKLRIVVYEIETQNVSFSFETEKMDYLSKACDMVTANYKLLSTSAVVQLRQTYMDGKRDDLPYMIDGLVIKANSIQNQKDLGYHGNGDPKGQIAFKFDARGMVTTLNDIKLTVGRTGVITPNAVIEPVNIDGSMVKAASIHNFDEVERLGIGIGDTIMVIKAGEIIPKITEVITSAGKKFKIPTKCPACGGAVEKDPAEAILRCTNEDCKGREFKALKHWVDLLKKRMHLEDIGESTIEQLYEKGLVKDGADFFKLTVDDITSLDRSGSKSAKKIVKGFGKCKEMDAVTFLAGLGIPSLGTTMAELLTEEYDLFALTNEVTESQLANISGIGPSRAKEIYEGLEKRSALIEKLMEVGVKIKKFDNVQLVSTKLQGKSFQITGALSETNPDTGKSYKREEWQALVESHGGSISRVNKDLKYLIVIRTSSNKIAKAQKLGIPQISEEDFWAMLND